MGSEGVAFKLKPEELEESSSGEEDSARALKKNRRLA